MGKKSLTLIIGVCLIIPVAIAQTWNPAVRLTWNSGGSYNPDIAIDSSDNIHVVWYDATPGNAEIFYRKSADGGKTWVVKRLTWTKGNSIVPVIAIDSSDNIHVVFYEAIGGWDIFYKKSTDKGATWTTKRLTWSGGFSWRPAIAIDSSDGIHVIWQDKATGNYEIYYMKSTDGGATWSSDKRLTWTSGSSYSKAIAIDSSDNIHVFWEDDTPGNDEIFYKKSTDGGNTWMTQRLSWTLNDSRHPDVAIDSGDHIHLVWRDGPVSVDEIYYKKSTDGGATWMTNRLSWSLGFSDNPAISIDSGSHIHVAWRGDPAGNDEIYYKRSTNGGVTWSSRRLSWSSSRSWNPALGIDSSGNIHVVWQDDAPGNDEIYYKKGIQ